MIRVSSLKKGDKFRIVPVQRGISTWIDEVRFIEEMMENPLMLDRYVRANGDKLSPYGEKVIYKMLMNYAYSVLDLRGNDVKNFMFHTMRNVAERYHEIKMETDKHYAQEQDRFRAYGATTTVHDYNMKRAFDDWDSYGVKVCYGCKTSWEDSYKDRIYYETHVPLPMMLSQKALNVWEFLKSVRPQTMAQDIVIYEDELQPILDLYEDDLHKLLIAYSMIIRAKLFEQSRCYWDEKTIVDDVTGEVFSVSNSCEGSHWNTPCITEYKNYRRFGKHNRSSYLIYELGFTDRRGVLNLYHEVLMDMYESGLFEDIRLLMKSRGGYSQTSGSAEALFDYMGTTPTYTIKDFDMKKKKVKLKRDRSAKTYLRMTCGRDLIGAYKPTFLTLHDDTKKVAFTIDYYKLTHGYILDFMEYLGTIKHKTVEGNKFRIATCSECGERQLILMDGKKGKMPKYCEECGSPKAKMKRKRAESLKSSENVTIEN